MNPELCVGCLAGPNKSQLSGTRGNGCPRILLEKADPCPSDLLRRGPHHQQVSLPSSPTAPVYLGYAMFSGTDSMSRSYFLIKTSNLMGARQMGLSSCSRVISFFFLPHFPSVLYPNLKELENYMGLSLSSQEVQQNLPQIPEGASVGIHPLTDMDTDVSALPLSWFWHENRLESTLSQHSCSSVS